METGDIVLWWRPATPALDRPAEPAVGVVALYDPEQDRVEVLQEGITLVGLAPAALQVVGRVVDGEPRWLPTFAATMASILELPNPETATEDAIEARLLEERVARVDAEARASRLEQRCGELGAALQDAAGHLRRHGEEYHHRAPDELLERIARLAGTSGS